MKQPSNRWPLLVGTVVLFALGACGSPKPPEGERLEPSHAATDVAGRSFLGIGNDCLRAGDYACALENYERAVSASPRSGHALTNLAWVLATAPDPAFRDGNRAIPLAEKAVSIAEEAGTLGENLGYLVALAGSYAEVGRFDDAVTVLDRVIEIAATRGTSSELMDRYHAYRRMFRQRRPWRYSPGQE